MPEGVTEALYPALVQALGEEKALAFWRWVMTEHPNWGRTGWGRIDDARKRC